MSEFHFRHPFTIALNLSLSVFFWLRWVLVLAYELLPCGEQTLWLWQVGHSYPIACGILAPQPGIKPTSPAFQGRFLTTGPPEKPMKSLQCPLFLLSSLWAITAIKRSIIRQKGKRQGVELSSCVLNISYFHGDRIMLFFSSCFLYFKSVPLLIYLLK